MVAVEPLRVGRYASVEDEQVAARDRIERTDIVAGTSKKPRDGVGVFSGLVHVATFLGAEPPSRPDGKKGETISRLDVAGISRNPASVFSGYQNLRRRCRQ